MPRHFRREWEAELEYREALLALWDKLDWRNKLKLLWQSLRVLGRAVASVRRPRAAAEFQFLNPRTCEEE